MKKMEIFKNDIRWQVQRKKVDEESKKLEDSIKTYNDETTSYASKDTAAYNATIYANRLRERHMVLRNIEKELVEGFKILHPDIVIEDEVLPNIW